MKKEWRLKQLSKTGQHQLGRANLQFIILLAACLLNPSLAAAAPEVTVVRKDASGVTFKVNAGTLRLQVFSPRVVRVTYGLGDSLPAIKSFSVVAEPERVRWKLTEKVADVRLNTGELEVRVAHGAVGFYDKAGKPVLLEQAGARSLTPARVGGFDVLQSRQSFDLPVDEAIFGLGQHPSSQANHRGTVVHLQQENRIVAVPVLVSSRGYGLLWDNAAVTDVDVGKSDSGTLTWKSEAADAIDYYFIQGPDLNDVVAAYRGLTGAAPLFPKWTWGFWQCRERYSTQKEILDVVGEYRKRQVPFDGIIQDWQYWKPGAWGSHEFDPERYPDPSGMVRDIHASRTHVIISVWPRFDLGLAHLAGLEKAQAVYSPVYPNVYPKGQGKWYDPFSPDGRRLYWQFLSDKLFSRGFDGWWMDASEAELGGKWGEMREVRTAAGPGAKVFNAYPLMHSTGVYEGQRAESAAKRVFILTRSAFAGQQRNSAVTWSGDTHGTWDVFAQQIPAGLNFVATGIPYWNTDIGGFFGCNPDDPKYTELFTRWFQFGAFCPMFRVHGTDKPKELWRFDQATQRIMTDFIELRYRLVPYIYSVSWQVTHAGASMMSPLVMSFRGDTKVHGLTDQFLFGPSLMANPVTKVGATNRAVYLPAGTSWTDFWTGRTYGGGQTVDAAAPIATMPLFVRAGSILPLGPVTQWADQPADPIELRVYRGANGGFSLYEDEGDNYNYEKGAYAIVPFLWNEAKQTLEIGARQGTFPGLVKERTFHVVWVGEERGTGIPATAVADRVIKYSGKRVVVRAGR